jgi:hypothetical protein
MNRSFVTNVPLKQTGRLAAGWEVLSTYRTSQEPTSTLGRVTGKYVNRDKQRAEDGDDDGNQPRDC